MTFAQPARRGSFLRFSAVAASIQLSTDGGGTYVDAARQQQSVARDEMYGSWWTPIPEGTTEVLFRATPTPWVGAWGIQDVAVFTPP